VAFAAIRGGVDPVDAEPVAQLSRRIDLQMGNGSVVVDGVDASVEIRGPEVSRAVSVVAANPEVRAEMRARQRAWAAERGGGVIEGRDIGSVVFPDAVLKVYLTADPEVRAQRRAKEMADLEYDNVAADLARRDAADQGRTHSPLVEADDAVVLDTTGMEIEEVLDHLVGLVEERTAARMVDEG
jgi:cytidylate kinase